MQPPWEPTRLSIGDAVLYQPRPQDRTEGRSDGLGRCIETGSAVGAALRVLDYQSIGANGVAPTALQGLIAFYYPGRRTSLRHGPMAWAGMTPHLRCWVALVPTGAGF